MDCDYCHKKFSTKATLLRHQQTVKFCIKIQDAIKEKIKVFACDGCNKKLSSKQMLQHHHQICQDFIDVNKIIQLEKTIEVQDSTIKKFNITIELQNSATMRDKILIEELKNRIRELELDIKDIALKSRAKTTTNNSNNSTTTYVYQNFTPITDEKLKEATINFTKRHLELGGQGVAHYALENTLKDNFVCTNISKGHSKYRDENGDLVVDPCSHTITRRVCESLVKPAEKLDSDNKNTLSGETSDNELIKAVAISDALKDIRHGANGLENDLTREFTKTLCSNNVKKCNYSIFKTDKLE